MSEYTDLLAKYKRLAKRADQRLVRIEQYSNLKYYKGIKSYSYKKAIKAITGYNENSRRFNAKKSTPKTLEGLKTQIKAMETFLNSPTSTKRGLNKVYKQRVDTINKKYGTSFTWQELAIFFDSGLAEKMDAKLGSRTMLQTIGKLQAMKSDVIEAIKNANVKDLRIDDNEAVNKKIIDLLEDNSLDIKKLLRKR